MDFAKSFLEKLSTEEINRLYSRYENFICKVSPNNFVSFIVWVNSFEDFPNVLRSLCK